MNAFLTGNAIRHLRSAGPMRRRHLLIATLIISPQLVPARPATAQSRALDEYVALGLQQNLGLKRQGLAAERSEAVVREARGNFLPSATINARYTDFRGSGVDFGAFINPVFATLNQLTGTSQFPTNVNVRLPLRQETTLRIAQPVFQPAVVAGYRAASAARDAQDATRDAAVVDVAAGIRSAYLQHAKARRLAELRVATRCSRSRSG
jgi:outer membrane protein